MDLIYDRTLSSPSANIFSGVSAMGNKISVTLLTLLSVLCADKIMATSNE